MNGLMNKEGTCVNVPNLYLDLYTLEGAGGSGLAPRRSHLFHLDATTVKITTTKLNFSMLRNQLGEENKSDFFAKCRKTLFH